MTKEPYNEVKDIWILLDGKPRTWKSTGSTKKLPNHKNILTTFRDSIIQERMSYSEWIYANANTTTTLPILETIHKLQLACTICKWWICCLRRNNINKLWTEIKQMASFGDPDSWSLYNWKQNTTQSERLHFKTSWQQNKTYLYPLTYSISH